MDFNTLLQAITTVGFPIVLCVALLYEIKDMTTKNQEKKKINSDSINKNTLVLQKLCHIIRVDREENEE